MALTTDDLNGVIAQWEEWTTGSEFRLTVEVLVDDVHAELAADCASHAILGRIGSDSRYILVQIHHGEHPVFSGRVAYSAEALRASVTVLARTIAAKANTLVDADG